MNKVKSKMCEHLVQIRCLKCIKTHKNEIFSTREGVGDSTTPSHPHEPPLCPLILPNDSENRQEKQTIINALADLDLHFQHV